MSMSIDEIDEAHVWSVRRFLRMTGANSIPTNIGRQTRLCLGISSNVMTTRLPEAKPATRMTIDEKEEGEEGKG